MITIKTVIEIAIDANISSKFLNKKPMTSPAYIFVTYYLITHTQCHITFYMLVIGNLNERFQFETNVEEMMNEMSDISVINI
jgi:hypothetical protein